MKSKTALAIAALAVPFTALVAPALTGMDRRPASRAPVVQMAGALASTGTDRAWGRGLGGAGDEAPVATPAAGGRPSAPPAAPRLAPTALAGQSAGTLAFSRRVLLETGFYTTASKVGIGDVTGDGRNDVVVLVQSSEPNRIPTTIQLFRQGADGTLQASVEVASRSSVDYRDMALGDIDGNGRDDIVIVTGGGLVAYRSLPDGTFAYAYADGISAPWHVHLMDVNLDGRLDAVTRDVTHGGHVFLGDGQGGFDEVQWLALQGGQEFVLGDVDSDQRPDVVAPDGNYFVDVLSGDLLAASARKYPLDVSLAVPLVAVGDFNRDGRGDVAVSNLHDEPPGGYRSGLQLLHQDATRTLAPPVGIPLDVEVQSMAAADLDADGMDDLVLLHGFYPMRIGWMRQGRDGLESLAPIGDGVDGAAEADAMAVGNVDGDLCPDIVAAFGSSVVLYGGSGCRPTRFLAVCRTQQPASAMPASLSSFGSVPSPVEDALDQRGRQGTLR